MQTDRSISPNWKPLGPISPLSRGWHLAYTVTWNRGLLAQNIPDLFPFWCADKWEWEGMFFNSHVCQSHRWLSNSHTNSKRPQDGGKERTNMPWSTWGHMFVHTRGWRTRPHASLHYTTTCRHLFNVTQPVWFTSVTYLAFSSSWYFLRYDFKAADQTTKLNVIGFAHS